MPTNEIVYIKFGEAGSGITAIGYILLFISYLQSERIEILKIFRINEIGIDPAIIATISAWTRLVGLGILAFTNSAKLNSMVYKQINKSNEEDIRPQLLNAIGSWILVIGIFIITIGSQQKAKETGLKSMIG